MSMDLKDDILNAVRESKINRICRCKTPRFRKPTVPPQYNAPPMPPVKPPPPPTSGSNAVKSNPNYIPPASVTKPRPTVFHMALENLNDWVKTSAQIGDVACGYDRETEHHYMYYYLKPDDNPVWYQMTPEFFEKHFKKENKGDEEMLGTINCTYSTPCGWCTKWDKKCDKKIGCDTTSNDKACGEHRRAESITIAKENKYEKE